MTRIANHGPRHTKVQHPEGVHYVYVAGPLTDGSSWLHARRAVQVGAALMRAGFYPFIPHLSMFSDMIEPQEYSAYLELDLAWIERCDAVVYLDGPSKGRDQEVAWARKSGLVVWPADDLAGFIAKYSPPQVGGATPSSLPVAP